MTPKQRIIIIAAIGEKRELGKDGDLPWHLPDDFKRFKKLTSGHYIIMGRKTWESFPRPLPNRTHVVITRQQDYKADQAIVVHDLQTALAACSDQSTVFIIGGGEIYNLALPVATHMELTLVHTQVEADAYFPQWKDANWKLVNSEYHEADDTHAHAFAFNSYVRR